jgi:hypothetical protein
MQIRFGLVATREKVKQKNRSLTLYFVILQSTKAPKHQSHALHRPSNRQVNETSVTNSLPSCTVPSLSLYVNRHTTLVKFLSQLRFDPYSVVLTRSFAPFFPGEWGWKKWTSFLVGKCPASMRGSVCSRIL